MNAVVFDKTGTLTEGEFGVTDLITKKDEEELLKLAASLESQSEHPIARGIVKKAKERGIKFLESDQFESITGKGLTGKVDGHSIQVISPGYVKEKGFFYDEDTFSKLSEEGKTVVFVIMNDELYGMIGLADQIRGSSKEAIQKLKNMDIEAMMLTGDNRRVAEWVGKQLQLDNIYAEVLLK